jgi:RsiW-degrading membrane proteinase PrsW (M82 family)
MAALYHVFLFCSTVTYARAAVSTGKTFFSGILIIMADPIALPPGVALGIIAFLLSLLPAGFFMWLWYLRRSDRSIPALPIALAFGAGLVSVIPAFWLEDFSERLWYIMSPETAHYFAGAVLPLRTLRDVLLPAVGTFLIVATVEEGIRYLIMRVWLYRSKLVDQVSDGLFMGVAIGLGFATLENTIYFLMLFQQGNFDTLVFVFFLRFLISTLAHVSFAGLMGALIARGMFDIYNARRYYLLAFFLPWFLHGLFDLLLGLGLVLHAVLLLIPPLVVFFYWTQKREFFAIYRKDGKLLAAAQAPEQAKELRAVQQILKTMDSPWNKGAPWLSQTKSYRKVLDAMKRNES